MIVNRPIKKKHLSRYNILFIIMAVIFVAIVLKLAYYQILNYDEYKEKANTISTRFISEKAPRGKIYDRNGYVLATNKQTYSITYTAPEKDDKDFFNTMRSLFKILDENNETLQDTMNLKIDENDNLYFEYMSSDKSGQDAEEKRFKKDRGIDYLLQKQMFKDEDELTENQRNQLDKAVLDLSLEDTFDALVKIYGLVGLVDPEYNIDKKKDMYSKMSPKDITKKILNEGYSLNEIRKFMLIKDAIKMQSFKGYKSVTITSNINRDTALIIYQKLNELPGIDVGLTPIRYYPFKELASSVLGYVSSIDSSQKETFELQGYDVSSDLVGKSGIEAAFEEQLKGTKGGSTVKVNSQGRPTEKLFTLESAPGNDVHLTIDSDIQYAAEHSLADTMKELQSSGYANATRGAAVAVDVKTGKILALVSYPNYDPNLFTVPGNLSSDEYKTYFNPDLEEFGNNFLKRMGLAKSLNEMFPKTEGGREDPYDLYPKPFYNYATKSLIPPGSTFKPLTAVAGLESGAIEPSTIIVDKGKFDEHPETFGKGFNPSGLEFKQTGSGVGPTSLTKAIAESINYYFYETAYRMYKLNGSNLEALDSIAKYAWQFGLGIDPNSNNTPSTGIEIKENFGQTYNFKSWKKRTITSSKFELVSQLENGYYEGRKVSFIPFDIMVNEDDNEKLAEAKKSIKDKFTKVLEKVGTDEQVKSVDDFAKSLKSDINDIMENSDKYKANVEKAKSEGKNVDLKEQANIIANAIATFTINDITTQIRSPGEIVNASIGQGMNNFTPLQLVSYIATLANGGTRYKMSLVDKITDNNGNVVQEFEPQVLNVIDMKDSTKQAVKEGMAAVNNEEGGTARSTFGTFPIPTAGKTGTADARGKDQESFGRRPYATYVSYAPVDDPEIAVSAVVFDGGHGSSIAPVVKSIFEAYFKDRLLQEYPNYAGMSSTFKKYIVENPNVELEKQTRFNPEN